MIQEVQKWTQNKTAPSAVLQEYRYCDSFPIPLSWHILKSRFDGFTGNRSIPSNQIFQRFSDLVGPEMWNLCAWKKSVAWGRPFSSSVFLVFPIPAISSYFLSATLSSALTFTSDLHQLWEYFASQSTKVLRTFPHCRMCFSLKGTMIFFFYCRCASW